MPLERLLLLFLFVALPLALFALAVFLQWRLSGWKRLPPTLRAVLLIAFPALCRLGGHYLDALNAATRTYANDWGSYFFLILFGVVFTMGAALGGVLGLLRLLWMCVKKDDPK